MSYLMFGGYQEGLELLRERAGGLIQEGWAAIDISKKEKTDG